MKIVIGNNKFRSELVAKVDSRADEVRRIVVGDPVRVKEYEVAAAEASTYKDSGYAGAVPETVQSWVDAKAAGGVVWTARQAADDILAASTRWYAALYKIRDLRLKTKEAIKAATSSDDAVAIYDDYEAQLTEAMKGVA